MNLTEELRYFADVSGASVAMIGSELQERFAPLLGEPLQHVVVARYADELPGDRPFRVPPVVAESEGVATMDGFIAWGEAMAERRKPAAGRAGADDLYVMPYTSARLASRKPACTRMTQSTTPPSLRRYGTATTNRRARSESSLPRMTFLPAARTCVGAAAASLTWVSCAHATLRSFQAADDHDIEPLLAFARS
jgi:hypothetical protein